ncbi:dipeptide ABC transporter permease DppC [Marinomonas sp. GJ51-6]|uniref:dipeptide ABC transporter permease DppC n=1 Tax=Marinomonas sp. GJ51-6 TaxID=2992802 RepID=UPI002934D358|nr:dipeptide ABC transporter permease DppC [Marinomonas sp. GJ51-6]WOD09009.1 dipeptide ABC transporter permease DppC [Marinomonas sp. GJ51-6]
MTIQTTSTTETSTDISQLSAPVPMTPFQEFWHYFSSNRGALGGLIVIALIFFMAIFANFVAPHSPSDQYRDALLLPPAWLEGGNWSFVLGTDDVGRDILSRLIHGSRLSIAVGIVAVTASLVMGILLGLVAGYFKGVIDTAIMRIVDIMLAMPSLLLAIAIVAILRPSIVNAALAISIVSLPHYVRLTRAATMAEMSRDYVTSSRVIGASPLRLMFVCILPNCLAPLIVQATLGFSTAILDMAALGFLGLGAQPPTPEWGSMLANALQFVQRAWWVVTFPGLMILITVLAFNLMGDGLRDALDPKLKQ